MKPTAQLAAFGGYAKRLMVEAQVWRKESTTDAGGGSVTDWVDQGRTVLVQLVSPTPQERDTAAQEGVEVSLSALMETDADVARGDRLVVAGRTVELLSDPQTATHSSISRAPVREEPFDEPTS